MKFSEFSGLSFKNQKGHKDDDTSFGEHNACAISDVKALQHPDIAIPSREIVIADGQEVSLFCLKKVGEHNKLRGVIGSVANMDSLGRASNELLDGFIKHGRVIYEYEVFDRLDLLAMVWRLNRASLDRFCKKNNVKKPTLEGRSSKLHKKLQCNAKELNDTLMMSSVGPAAYFLYMQGFLSEDHYRACGYKL